MNLLEVLRPYNIHDNKKRIGSLSDGGYVMSEIVLKNCTALMTYGVGNDTSYEYEFSKLYEKKSYLFDHTIGRSPWEDGLLKYVPEGLGDMENCKEWYEHYQELNLNGDVFLKIDIEGGEFNYFEKTNYEKLNENVIGLIIEFHYIDDYNLRNRFIEIIKKFDGFLLTHIHGNNWGGIWTYENYILPKVIEVSLVNKKYVNNYELDTNTYPITGLDYPNNPNEKDIDFKFIL